jgi:hypothetical protein
MVSTHHSMEKSRPRSLDESTSRPTEEARGTAADLFRPFSRSRSLETLAPPTTNAPCDSIDFTRPSRSQSSERLAPPTTGIFLPHRLSGSQSLGELASPTAKAQGTAADLFRPLSMPQSLEISASHPTEAPNTAADLFRPSPRSRSLEISASHLTDVWHTTADSRSPLPGLQSLGALEFRNSPGGDAVIQMPEIPPESRNDAPTIYTPFTQSTGELFTRLGIAPEQRDIANEHIQRIQESAIELLNMDRSLPESGRLQRIMNSGKDAKGLAEFDKYFHTMVDNFVDQQSERSFIVKYANEFVRGENYKKFIEIAERPEGMAVIIVTLASINNVFVSMLGGKWDWPNFGANIVALTVGNYALKNFHYPWNGIVLSSFALAVAWAAHKLG